MIGKLFKNLFGGDKTPSEPPAGKGLPPVQHGSFLIIPEPRQHNGQWQVAGRIEKQSGDEVKSHTFIRADTLGSAEEAGAHMVRKAQMMIDQQGDSIFS
ncbi:HlyU family transcriptional regulator [Roseibium sp. RKSG952]|uniref:HlyU family transcriptional regulator n=1 Tax=Roseibium sp. RKSG952 TaxID=2529384 RepID=UPI0012BCCBA8|nr:HlyU family transcriptional regulator [Roseibium sp. RKSG952]MTH98146.1 transcriptional regulator [Roseibium sp. RKSG952]